MRFFVTFLLFFAFAIGVAAQDTPVAKDQAKEPTHQGKTLADWSSRAAVKDPAVQFESVAALQTFGSQAVPELAKLLQAENSKVRLAAASALQSLGYPAEAAAPALIKALGDKDSRTRRAAASALGEINLDSLDPDPAVRPLTTLLQDGVPEVRRAAVAALEKHSFRGQAALPEIIKLFDDKDARVREAAASVVGSVFFRAAEALPGLTQLLNDEDANVRRAAVVSLGEIGFYGKPDTSALLASLKDKDSGVREAAAAAVRGMQLHGEVVIAALSATLKDEDSRVRRTAALALGSVGRGRESASHALVAAARDKDASVRGSVAEALGQLGAVSIPALKDLLKDNDVQVQSAALTAIGVTGQEGIPTLREFLRDNDSEKRKIVANALRFTGTAGIPSLLELLKDKDAAVRESAAWSLRDLGAEAGAAVPALTALLKDKDKDVRAAALCALEEIGPDASTAIPAIIELLQDKDTREKAISSLGRFGPDAAVAVPALTDLLRDKDVRCAAADALGHIGPAAKTAVPVLVDLLKISDVRPDAIGALGQIGPDAKAAVPALTDLLAEKVVQRDAAAALCKIGPTKAAVPALTELLKDGDSQKTAAEALGKIGPDAKAAVPALTDLLKQQWPEFYVKALGKIGPEAKAAVPALIELLKTDNDYQRSMIIEALGNIGPPAKAAVPALVPLLKAGNNWAVIARTLEKIGSETKNAIPDFAALVKDRRVRTEIRQAAGFVLAKTGSAALPALVGLLKDADEDVRWYAVWALGAMGSEAKAAVPALAELLREQDPSLRQCLSRTLGRLGADSMPSLRTLLKDEDVAVRWMAVRAIAEIGPKEKPEVSALIELLNDPNREVAAAAAFALGKPDLDAPTESDSKRIKGFIAELADIEDPDYAFSPTLTGDAFAPIASSGRFRMGLLTDHGLKKSPAFAALVSLGPRSLPFLLESLDDKTPTKLVIRHRGGMGGMWFGHEIGGNPFNIHEAQALANESPNRDATGGPSMQNEMYRVKVGDVCFAAIGQITNRSYNAVRYQPTACIVINSTVQDKELAADVRAIWGKTDHRRKLLESLLVDFCVRGPNEDSLQAGAAMRLAYYFPEISEGVLLRRLKDVEPAMLEPWKGENLGHDEFLAAISVSPQPKIHAELLEVVRKTKNPKILLAALPGIGNEHGSLIHRRIEELLADSSNDEPGPYSDAFYLLVALGMHAPEHAQAAFENFLKPATVNRCRTVIYALRETCGDLSVKLLYPLLTDKRNTPGCYSVNQDESEPYLPTRVCDEAAETIAMNSKTFKFALQGQHEDLDRQIESMRASLARSKRSE